MIRLKNWLKKADNSKAKRKRLNFKKGGNLNSNTLWTDGWLVSLASQSAQKLHSLSVNGKDYLLLQKGGFEKVLSLTDEEREAWEPKYTILRRADEVIKETKDFLKKNKLAPGRKKKK